MRVFQRRFRETVFKPVDQHFLRFINQHMPEIRNAPSTAQMTDLYAKEGIRANFKFGTRSDTR